MNENHKETKDHYSTTRQSTSTISLSMYKTPQGIQKRTAIRPTRQSRKRQQTRYSKTKKQNRQHASTVALSGSLAPIRPSIPKQLRSEQSTGDDPAEPEQNKVPNNRKTGHNALLPDDTLRNSYLNTISTTQHEESPLNGYFPDTKPFLSIDMKGGGPTVATYATVGGAPPPRGGRRWERQRREDGGGRSPTATLEPPLTESAHTASHDATNAKSLRPRNIRGYRLQTAPIPCHCWLRHFISRLQPSHRADSGYPGPGHLHDTGTGTHRRTHDNRNRHAATMFNTSPVCSNSTYPTPR